MAQSTNSSSKEKDVSLSASITSPFAQAALSRYLQEQHVERLKMYYKYLKQKTEAGNITSLSICPLLHFFDVSEFKISSQKNNSNAQQTHSAAAAACRRKCNSVSIKYFNYGEKSAFQHGISAYDALEEYRRANVYTRSRLYKSNQDALEISILMKSDILKIPGVPRVNDTYTKSSAISFVVPSGDSLKEKSNKRRHKEKVSFAFRNKYSKERSALQMSVVSLGMDTKSQGKEKHALKSKNSHRNVTSTRDLGRYQEINTKKSFRQSASEPDISTFVEDSRHKQKPQTPVKQRKSLCVSSTMLTPPSAPTTTT